MNPITIITLYFFLGTLLTYFLFDVLSQGFLSTFLKVRFSRDKRCMIKIYSASRVYYKAGKETEGVIEFKNSKKEDQTINAKDKTFYRSMNINWIDYSEVKNAVIMPTGEYTESIDPVRNENMHKRALQSPEVRSNSQKLKHGILILMGLIGLMILLWLAYQNMGKLDLIIELIPKSVGVIP